MRKMKPKRVGQLFLLIAFSSFFFLNGRNAIALTLREAIKIALERNYQILNFKDELENARLNLELTEKNLFAPQVELNLSPYGKLWKKGMWSSLSELQLTGKIGFSNGSQLSAHYTGDYRHEEGEYSDYYGVQLDLPLFQDVELSSPSLQLHEVRLSVKKSELKLDQAGKDLLINVIKSFYRLKELRDSLKVAKEKLKQREREVEKLLQQVNLGTAGRLELLSAKINLESSKKELDVLQDEFSLALDEFCHSLGLEKTSSSLVYPEIKEEKLKEKAKELLMRKITEEVLTKDKEVKEARWAVEQAELRLRQKRQALSPSFSVSIGYSSGNELEEDELEEWKATFGLTYKLFDGGQGRLSERIAQGQLEIARRNLENAKRSVQLAILSKRNALREALSQLRLLELKREEMRFQEKLKEEQFRLKLISSDQLRDFQIERMSSENDYRAALHELLICYLSYRQALGMDLEIDEVISK